MRIRSLGNNKSRLVSAEREEYSNRDQQPKVLILFVLYIFFVFFVLKGTHYLGTVAGGEALCSVWYLMAFRLTVILN